MAGYHYYSVGGEQAHDVGGEYAQQGVQLIVSWVGGANQAFGPQVWVGQGGVLGLRGKGCQDVQWVYRGSFEGLGSQKGVGSRMGKKGKENIWGTHAGNCLGEGGII